MIVGMSGEATIRRQLGEAGARLLREVRYRGHEIIEARVKKYGIACDLKHGWMEAAARPRHMRDLRCTYEELVAGGDSGTYALIEPDEMRSVLGTDVYHGGLIDRRSGHLHPLNLLLGEARAAAGLGAKVYERSKVLELEGGANPVAVTDRGRVEANAIVLAGNTDHAFQRGRLNGVQLPTGSYIVATEPLSEARAGEINPQDLAVADSNVVLDYFRLSADRRMLFGGRCNYSNRDPKDITATLRPRLIRIFPQLSGSRIDFAWGGRLGITVNRAPAIGRLEPNLYYLEGYVGHGVNVTHIAAEIISDAICGTTEKFDLFDKLSHIRLPVGRWAGNQILALGMLYYRLRDLL
jgi:glycine/D-amino acid oxidase-like deaminating enzyme